MAERGEPRAAEELLPLVYEELRRLAARRLAREKPGQTLQATALVNEAYMRLVGGDGGKDWDGRGHFFAAAAEAMRRIVIDNARRKRSEKRGGGFQRQAIDEVEVVAATTDLDVLALDEALTRIAPEGISDAAYAEVREQFAEAELSDLTWRVAAINGWNRLNVAFRNMPGSKDKMYGLDKAGLN